MTDKLDFKILKTERLAEKEKELQILKNYIIDNKLILLDEIKKYNLQGKTKIELYELTFLKNGKVVSLWQKYLYYTIDYINEVVKNAYCYSGDWGSSGYVVWNKSAIISRKLWELFVYFLFVACSLIIVFFIGWSFFKILF